MSNIFIVEEDHLRNIVSETFRDGDANVMIRYGLPRMFLMMMNLVVITDRYEKKTMTIVKNRWSDPERSWTMPGVHDISNLSFLIDYIEALEKICVKFD